MLKIFAPLVMTFALLCFSCGEESQTETTNSTSDSRPTVKAEDQPGSPEEFAYRLANFVIDSNYQGIADMIIQKQEMVELISNSSVTQAGKEAAISHVDVEIAKMKMDMSNGLREIRSSGTTAGMYWPNCKYKDARYDVAQPNGYDMMQLKVELDCNGITNVFTVTDVVRTKNGWKLGGKMMFGDFSRQ